MTHDLFHDKTVFETLDSVSPQKVKIADGTSKIIGKGTVKVKLGTDIEMEAYYFSSKIVSANTL